MVVRAAASTRGRLLPVRPVQPKPPDVEPFRHFHDHNPWFCDRDHDLDQCDNCSQPNNLICSLSVTQTLLRQGRMIIIIMTEIHHDMKEHLQNIRTFVMIFHGRAFFLAGRTSNIFLCDTIFSEQSYLLSLPAMLLFLATYLAIDQMSLSG